MRWRYPLPAICCVGLLAVAFAPSGVLAQRGQDIFVTPIPDAPFSAVIQVQRTLVQRGGVFNLRTTREIGRDSRGRIYNEKRQLLRVGDTATPELLGVLLYDPQTRISTHLDTIAHTFWTGTVDRPPSTVPPALLASPAGTNLPQNQFVKEEDLGVHEIDGVSAHGVRETQTIPAESSGTGQEVLITDEYWYAQDLRINLIVKHSDRRTGSVTMMVTKIARTDPDPAHFAIPEGYKSIAQLQPTAQ